MAGIKNYLLSRKLILLVTLIYTAIILTVLLNRFWQYEAFYYDHGMMEGTAYQVSQLQMPVHDRQYGRVSIYIDHLYPSLQLFLAPFYWLNSSYETPIVVMAVTIGLSVLVAYEIAKKYIKNHLMIYALLFAYMFYIGMQNALIFFIHDITVEIPFLMLLFWSITNSKIRLFYLLLIINLGFKESVSITTAAIGLFMFIAKPPWRKHAIVTILISTAYALLAAKVVIPFFYTQAFGVAGQFRYTPQLSANPLTMLSWFVDTAEKRETIVASLTSFGWLPIFFPPSLILIVQDLAQRFVLIDHASTLRQGLNLHYNANLAVILFYCSVLAVARLEKHKWYRKFGVLFHAILIVLVVGYFHRVAYRGPLGLVYNPEFYRITTNMKFMDDFVAKIPTTGKLMIQNNLAVRFTHNNLYLLLGMDHLRSVNPDVVAMDYRPGQNPNNYWPVSDADMASISAQLLADPRYRVIYADDYRYIFQKK